MLKPIQKKASEEAFEKVVVKEMLRFFD